MADAPRAALAQALSAMLSPEQLAKLIDDVLAIRKRASAEFFCKSCNKRQMQYVEIADAKAVALALPDLLNQAYGRPQEANQQGDPVLFKRLTVLSDDEELEAALRTVQEDRRRHGEQRRQDGALHSGPNGQGNTEAAGDPDLQGIDPGDDETEGQVDA